MTRLRLPLIATVVLLLLLGAGIAWYLFAPNGVAAAELVPGDTLGFATIPNAASWVTGYQTSQLKTLVDSPNAQPLLQEIQQVLGPKNLALLNRFLPNLSGQSFIAITRVDPEKIENLGFVAGMRPKYGLATFDQFVDQLKAAYPDLVSQAKTGSGNVAGIDYQWIQGPGANGKICIAKIKGWIVTSWGEASLQDFLSRLNHQGATPSLADNPDYKKSLERVGRDSSALVYVNYGAGMNIFLKMFLKSNPVQAAYLGKRFAGLGGAAAGTRFEGGEIVDRFSILEPRQVQLKNGMAAGPCAFETLKFTGSETLFYLGAGLNWNQIWKNFQDQMAASPGSPQILQSLQNWAQENKLDVQRNLIDPLGSEYSMQLEWSADSLYPELGLFLKIDKPDDFKPTITALIDTLRHLSSAEAVVNEIKVEGHHFATFKPVQPIPISPTITEDGPYLGLFLTENQAVRSFQRTENVGLLQNADFKRQLGDKRQNASELVFVDSPRLLDHAYRIALPYSSMAAMLNQKVAAALKDRQLPPDLTWLAPIGTWSFVASTDDDGIKGYSASGIGNQGLFGLAGLGGISFAVGETMPMFRPQPPPSIPANSFPTSPATLPPAAGGPPVAPVENTGTNSFPVSPLTNSSPVPSEAPPASPPTNIDAAPAPAETH